MAVPFRDLTADEGLGLAGYLRYVDEPNDKGMRGALFFVTAKGEPVDFSFCRIDAPSSFLWRPGQARQHAVGALTRALFVASSKEPTLLLALAEEVSPRLFAEDLEVLAPLCRVAEDDAHVHATNESVELLAGAIHLFWVGDPPGPESLARRLLDTLHARNLMMEPFERAVTGLEEAFKQL